MPAADGDRAMGARSADGARTGKLDWCRGAVIEKQTMTKRIDGVREVGVPAAIVPDLRDHLRRWSERGPQGRVFVGPRGGRLLRSNYSW
jgi:hypothetical protein